MNTEAELEHLIKLLQEKSPVLRADAAYDLGVLGDQRGVESLIAALKDEDMEVRAMVADALHQITIAAHINGYDEDKRAVEPLLQALNDEKMGTLRRFVVKALGEYRDERATIPLINLLDDENEDLRYFAVRALNQIADKRAIEPLIKTLKDKNKEIRAEAAASLGSYNLEDSKSVKPLIQALEDDSGEVRGAAAIALGNIGDVQAIQPLLMALEHREDSELFESTIFALSHFIDGKIIGILLSIFPNIDSHTRYLVANVWGELGNKQVLEALEWIKQNDPDIDVQNAASEAIANIKEAT